MFFTTLPAYPRQNRKALGLFGQNNITDQTSKILPRLRANIVPHSCQSYLSDFPEWHHVTLFIFGQSTSCAPIISGFFCLSACQPVIVSLQRRVFEIALCHTSLRSINGSVWTILFLILPSSVPVGQLSQVQLN